MFKAKFLCFPPSFYYTWKKEKGRFNMSEQRGVTRQHSVNACGSFLKESSLCAESRGWSYSMVTKLSLCQLVRAQMCKGGPQQVSLPH